MKIHMVTAGAAGMYCGSCFRDNALAAELKSRGHDVLLLPIYTPTLTDDGNVSERRVFFGGISVYLQQYISFFRKTPWLFDRLWDSPLAIRAATHFSVSTEPSLLGDLTISMLRGKDGYQAKELAKLLHWLEGQPAPDVVILPNSLLIGLAEPIKKALRRPILCTLQGEDLFLEGLIDSYKKTAINLIRQNVENVDGFIAVSDYYMHFMSGYLQIPSERIRVVPLGISLEGFELRRQARSEPFTVGYFARVTPEKGLHNLCEAYRIMRHEGGLPESRLEAAGYLAVDHKGYLNGIERQMKEWGLGDEFRYRGALDRKEKIEFLRNLDVLSVPSSYHESKGMYLLEAMACGVPVVQPRHGAFPEIIDKTGGGILVDSEDGEHMAAGLLSLWKDPSRAAELGRAGAEGVRAHYSVGNMASRALEAYGEFVRQGGKEP